MYSQTTCTRAHLYTYTLTKQMYLLFIRCSMFAINNMFSMYWYMCNKHVNNLVTMF